MVIGWFTEHLHFSEGKCEQTMDNGHQVITIALLRLAKKFAFVFTALIQKMFLKYSDRPSIELWFLCMKN